MKTNRSTSRVHVVDYEEIQRTARAIIIALWCYAVETASDGQEALDKLASFPAHVIVTDLNMPRMTGQELLEHLKDQSGAPATIVQTAFGNLETSVSLIHDLGAFWFLEKPVQSQALRLLIERAASQTRLAGHAERLERQLSYQGVLGELVGNSEPMQTVFPLVRQVAPSRAAGLLTGESGTGRVDETGDMPAATQAKLLRVLEDGSVRRLGGKSEIQLDVRVISSTNAPLDSAIKENKFREDLYYRLNVFPIPLPPLRDHKDDLGVLCAALLEDLNRKHSTKVTELATDVLDRFLTYAWPGNVRELRNVLERAVILAGEGTIQTMHLPPGFAGARPAAPAGSQQPAELR